jgi:hypothetical protein
MSFYVLLLSATFSLCVLWCLRYYHNLLARIVMSFLRDVLQNHLSSSLVRANYMKFTLFVSRRCLRMIANSKTHVCDEVKKHRPYSHFVD